MYRVWRYRGGRDGHETLQQFMNFLGREKETEAEPITYGEGTTVRQEGDSDQRKGLEGASSSKQKNEEGISETTGERLGPNTYAGVVIFCVPIVAATGRGNVDLNTLQVWE